MNRRIRDRPPNPLELRRSIEIDADEDQSARPSCGERPPHGGKVALRHVREIVRNGIDPIELVRVDEDVVDVGGLQLVGHLEAVVDLPTPAGPEITRTSVTARLPYSSLIGNGPSGTSMITRPFSMTTG